MPIWPATPLPSGAAGQATAFANLVRAKCKFRQKAGRKAGSWSISVSENAELLVGICVLWPDAEAFSSRRLLRQPIIHFLLFLFQAQQVVAGKNGVVDVAGENIRTDAFEARHVYLKVIR